MLNINAAGRLGKDAVTRYAQDGTAFTGFSIAIDMGKDGNGNDKPARWLECTIKGDRGKKLQPYLTKGMAVAVTGFPDAGVFTKQDGTTTATLKCWVDKLTFLGGGERREDGSQNGGEYEPGADDLNDSIPF